MKIQLKIICVILFTLSRTVNGIEKLKTIEMSPLKNTPFYTIDVKVGDYETTKMLVDTGASDTVIADWFIKKIKFF